MNKKGNAVLLLVGASIGVILLAVLIAPTVKQYVSDIPESDVLTKTNSSANETYTLAHTDLKAASFSIPGLTVTDNYTIDYATAQVNLTDKTVAGSYIAYYAYYDSGYLDNAGERTLLGVVLLASLIGLIYFIFKGFGFLD